MIERALFASLTVSFSLLSASPPPAAAAGACIPPGVSDALAACSGDHLQASATKRTPAPIGPVAPPKASKGSRAAGPPDAGPSARDLRRALASMRATPLLIAEIQGLESLLTATSAGSPDRPGILRRLADGYVELEAVSFRKKMESRIRADEVRRRDPAKAGALAAEAAKAEKVEIAARQAAIKEYEQLRARYPRWCQSPAVASAPGCADEVLYDLAYEHEQNGDPNQARKVYLELIQTAPASRYVPSAYLAFGELFFQEAQGDPSKWALAEQSYREVARFPAPENKVLGYAHYKLAYVYWNKGDLPLAVGELKKTIEVGRQFPTLPNAGQLATSARRDLVPLYALTGDAKKAYEFFHPLSEDSGGDASRTYRWMAELGQGLLDVGRYRDGIEVYQDLLRRDHGPRSCEYQARVTEATLALKTGDKAAARAELDQQLQLELRFRAEGHPEEVKLACASATAALAAETAMIWHLEAVGSGDVRGTMAPETMTFAAELYDRLIKQFTAAEFAKFAFPRLVKEDWPSRLKLKAARADLLYAQKEWAPCGEAFGAVVDEDPSGPLAAESAYTSALCYQHASLAAHVLAVRPAGHGERAEAAGALTPRELSPTEKAMLASFDRFLCVVSPNPADKAAYDSYVEVEVARARTYFDAHRWAEAAAGFKSVALSRSDHEAGLHAAELYLEALNVMESHGTPSCLEDMARDVPRIVATYCAGAKGKASPEQCGGLTRVERDVEWRGVERMAADMKGDTAPGRSKQWEAIANAYLRIWTTHGKEACEAKQPACDRMDAVLVNAASAFQAARLLAKAIAVRKVLLDPRENLGSSKLARGAAYDIGQNYQAIAVYDEAASWYERFAHDAPELDKAAQALQDAIVLRLGTGQEDQALRDAEQFERTYHTGHPALTAQIAFAIGAHYAEHEDFAQARKHLGAAMGAIDRSATLDVQIQAHALLGRVLWKTGGETGAAAEYARVRSLYRDPAAVLARLKALGGDEVQEGHRLAKVLTAVGEAIFFSATQKQKVADALVFPEYRGSGRRADVQAHIDTKVLAWMNKKRPAIEEAEREYRKVVDLEPAPPPRWVIASGARVGQMWGKFVAEFRAAPIPKEWRQNGPSPFGDLRWEEIRGAYINVIDEKSEPFRQRAKAAYQGCLQVSSRYQFFDEHSRACELWLSRNYSAEFHAVDELRGSPSRLGVRVEGSPVSLVP